MATLILVVTVEDLEEDTDREKIREEVYAVLNNHYTYSNVEVDFLDDH